MVVARLLDVTRSLRRAGRGATGVDRVERAYLDHFLNDEAPVFGIARTRFGYVLVDREGLKKFRDRLEWRLPWGDADFLSRLPGGPRGVVAKAESDLRRDAVMRATPKRLSKKLAKAMPAWFEYYNVGHSNLTERMFDAVGNAKGKVHVLIHDVIPLEHPEFQRKGTVSPFRTKIDLVARMADRVIYNSEDTKSRCEGFMVEMGRVPPCVVAYLGVDQISANNADMPATVDQNKPYFVCVGTIEPRKNHAFLLRLWEEMGPAAPNLYLCGARGWKNKDVFARLDSLSKDHPIKELPDLSDKELRAVMKGAKGLLMPSIAEGYGLPPIEAAILGMRVLCNNLTVYREVLGEFAVYVPVSERYLWIKQIKEWEVAPLSAENTEKFTAPTWAEHFNVVLK
jgi:glycosyltransferase involved in cell wall biosynthesis